MVHEYSLRVVCVPIAADMACSAAAFAARPDSKLILIFSTFLLIVFAPRCFVIKSAQFSSPGTLFIGMVFLAQVSCSQRTFTSTCLLREAASLDDSFGGGCIHVQLDL